jgi:DNA-directed RNA polymerase subunit RPC12/RpoP
MVWKCDVCGTVNSSDVKGPTVTCKACHELFIVEGDVAMPKKSAEEWLGTISTQLEILNTHFADAEAFREKEKKVLSEIEVLLRRYK